MRSWCVVVLVLGMVAATGKVVRADPAAGIPSRVGIDGMAGGGLLQLLGVAARLEAAVSKANALTLRGGHLQVRSIDNESKELYPIYFVHGGYRRYAGWFFIAAEAGVIAGKDYRGWDALPNGELTVGGKSTSIRTELGLSFMANQVGFSLVAHLGFDFVAW